jgi:dTDP-4-amino-4,6-dideoxygalactose transaminase
MRVPFVDLKAQYRHIADEVDEAIRRVVSSAEFILGADLESFENEFAGYCGARYGVGVDSGASALELSLRACGIGPGDEVITVSHTFIATVSAISWTGAHPVLVDIDPQTFNIDPTRIEQALTGRTRAIIPVHLYGQTADMRPINEIARAHGLVVIEDACQAHGAQFEGRRAGSLADVACFSFYPGKNLGAYGDAGMIVTSDAKIAAKARMLRNYGQRTKNKHEMLGYNRRLDNLQAALLRVKLRYLDRWNALRQSAARMYDEILGGVETVVVPWRRTSDSHVYHLYVIKHECRDSLLAHLAAHEVSAGLHYPIPVHRQPSYEFLGLEVGALPATEHAASRVLSLPIYPEIEAEQIEKVCSLIKSFW